MRDLYVSWTNDRGIGKAYISYTGKGNYYGEGSLMYTISPASVKNFKAVAGIDSVTLTWDKAPGAGYYRLYKGANGGDWKDISANALEIAQENARLLGVDARIRFHRADVFRDPICDALSASADLIISNPPYIDTAVIPTLSEEVRREPHIALDGGADGMDFYRHFIRHLAPRMKPHARMILEIGYDQGERMEALCREAGLACTLHRDFGGNIRVAEVARVAEIARGE